MKPILVLAAVLACASARVLIPGGYAPQSVVANQGSVALGGVGSTVVATGTANAAGLRGIISHQVKREPYGYGYPGYGYGSYAPQNVAANQNSNAVGGPGSTVVATGTANAAGQRWKRSPQYYGYGGYYPGYGYGGYRSQAVTANQESNAVGGDGSTVVASGTSNAGASRVKRGAYLLSYDPYFSSYYGGYGLGYGWW